MHNAQLAKSENSKSKKLEKQVCYYLCDDDKTIFRIPLASKFGYSYKDR